MSICEICGAFCQWEPGGPIYGPPDDDTETCRRISAHYLAIVKGAGSNGISVRDLFALVGQEYTDVDGDDMLYAPDAIEAA
jgi:hypothetical protein